MPTAVATVAPPRSAARRRNLVIDLFGRLVGPAALTAAGMIGAGAVATRLLAGAWFGFDLIWVALAIIPMVIVTLDSASRVGILSGGHGMLARVRAEIAPWLAWAIFLPTALVNIVVNMSQMSAMVEGTYGALGMLPRVKRSTQNEGHERRYFYGSVWAVCIAQPGLWLLWKILPRAQTRDLVKLLVFVGILAYVGNMARRGLLPRTRPIVPGELAVSD